MISLMSSRRPVRPAENQLILSLIIFPPAGEAGRKIINDFPPAGEAGRKKKQNSQNLFILQQQQQQQQQQQPAVRPAFF